MYFNEIIISYNYDQIGNNAYHGKTRFSFEIVTFIYNKQASRNLIITNKEKKYVYIHLFRILKIKLICIDLVRDVVTKFY